MATRAIRRAGELLKQIEPATGKNNQYSQVKGEGAQPFHSRKQAASDAGMSSHQHKQATIGHRESYPRYAGQNGGILRRKGMIPQP